MPSDQTDNSKITRLPRLEFGSNYINPCVPRRAVFALATGQIPALGAHLVTPFLSFTHHGIYCGDGRVIHYGALMYDIVRKPVEEVSLEEFAGGRPVFVVEHGEACHVADEIIRRARTRLGEKSYRLFTNNCEHFVEWCLHGVSRSFQAETALAYPRVLGERIEGLLLALLRKLMPGRLSDVSPPVPVVSRDPPDEHSGSRADRT